MEDNQSIKNIQNLYLEVKGKSIDEYKAEAFESAINSIRDSSLLFKMYPKHVMSLAFKCDEFYNKSFYPCDIIELRDILANNKIFNIKNIVLLSNKFAEKIIRDYKCGIILDIDPKEIDAIVVGGIAILKSSSLDIGNIINSIVTSKNSPKQLIRDIVNEEKPECPVYDNFFIHGLDSKRCANKKVAQTQGPSISLNSTEQNIFSILLDVKKQQGLSTSFRVAGGWVRDKLMGKESDDIDIALDDMTGSEFLRHVSEYHAKNPNAPIGKDYVVEQNPDKSKHLETTAIEIGGMKIDFVNLRSESYGSESRVPTMEFGDPETDAQRRDLTINALFYNIDTGQIEDYTGGLEDFQNGVLRTPLDSNRTFLDDPLRMLRVLRFYSRYDGFQISPETLEAMSDPNVHEAYVNKVSPERAGPEILKMFAGEGPEKAIRVLYETGMDKALLNMPDFENLNPFQMNQMNPNHQLNLMDHTLRVMENYKELLRNNGIEGKDRALAIMASWFHDFGKMHPEIQKPKDDNPEHMTYHGHEDVSEELANNFIKSIGIGEDDREFVSTIVKEHMYPHAHTSGDWSKRMMGKLRHKTTIPGQDRDDIWKFVMWHSHADAAAKSEETKLDQFPNYEDQFRQTEEYMSAPPPMKPLIGGRRIIELFPELDPKTGFIKYINNLLLDEQNAGLIQTEEQAAGFVESIRSDVESRFGVKNSMSWYSKIKIADASSSEQTDGYNYYEGQQPYTNDDDGQIKMIRRTPGKASRYRSGDPVRDRKSKREGVVRSVDDNKIRVKWNKGEDESFDITSIDVPIILERI